MRLSPDGKRLVYVAGLGQRPAAPMVTVVEADGSSHWIVPGHHPCWVDASSVLWCPQDDGAVQIGALDGSRWRSFGDTALLAGNTLASGAGSMPGSAFAVHRTDPRRVLTNAGRVILGAMDPAVSDDGRWLAYVMADRDAAGNVRDGVSTLYVERVDGSQARRMLWEGAPTGLRFGGTTLVWQVGRGIIAGCADVSNPAVGGAAFTLPSAWKLTHPVPVWVAARNELLVLFVADSGEKDAPGFIYLASWTSLKQGEPRGFALGSSTGSAFDHDARPVGSTSQVRVQWLDPAGLVDGLTKELASARVMLAPPAKPEPPPPIVLPPALPDIPWTTDPNGVIEDIAVWLFSRDQGPDITFSPDGRIRCFVKSDEGSGDGPGQYIGEQWDLSPDPNDFNIGHLEDASMGRRVLNGREVYPWDIPDEPAGNRGRVWASCKLQRVYFADRRRLWMPRRLVSGTTIRYRTVLTWTCPPWETPTTNLWSNITIDIRIDVGYGRYRGREVRARVAYVPNGNEEVNYYGEPKGYNAWIIAAGKSDPWEKHETAQLRSLVTLSMPVSFDPRDYVRTFTPPEAA